MTFYAFSWKLFFTVLWHSSIRYIVSYHVLLSVLLAVIASDNVKQFFVWTLMFLIGAMALSDLAADGLRLLDLLKKKTDLSEKLELWLTEEMDRQNISSEIRTRLLAPGFTDDPSSNAHINVFSDGMFGFEFHYSLSEKELLSVLVHEVRHLKQFDECMFERGEDYYKNGNYYFNGQKFTYRDSSVVKNPIEFDAYYYQTFVRANRPGKLLTRILFDKDFYTMLLPILRRIK